MKIKPKILSPHLRLKKRYLVFKVFSEYPIDFDTLSHAIYSSLLEFSGELNTGLSRIWIMKDLWNEKEQIGVIRCSHTAVELVRSSLILLERIGDSKVSIRILGVSGTIEGAKRKFMIQHTLEDFDV